MGTKQSLVMTAKDFSASLGIFQRLKAVKKITMLFYKSHVGWKRSFAFVNQDYDGTLIKCFDPIETAMYSLL